jgi:predicted XRE-type DNA-binding protein
LWGVMCSKYFINLHRMTLKELELLESPDYLLTKYQNEIYRQLCGYMDVNKLSQKDVAKKLGVSNAYISQVLNGNFNFTLKKLIELGLAMGKVPRIEFMDKEEYHSSKKRKNMEIPITPVVARNQKLRLVK